jgi:hypothetical protein
MLQTVNFQAGGRLINAAATYFRYESGTAGGADETIRVRADGNDLGTYLPGDYVELPVMASTWEVIPIAAQTVGIVRLGVGRVGSARTVGVVRVVDSERDKVMAGVCFRSASTAVGNAPALQLYNPAGSGKNLFATAVRGGALTADSWGVRTTVTQYGTLAGGQAVNLDVTSTASVAQIRADTAATVPAAPKGYAAGYMQASSDVVVVFPRPVLIRPGTGLDFYINTNPNTLRANFEWEEWPV